MPVRVRGHYDDLNRLCAQVAGGSLVSKLERRFREVGDAALAGALALAAQSAYPPTTRWCCASRATGSRRSKPSLIRHTARCPRRRSSSPGCARRAHWFRRGGHDGADQTIRPGPSDLRDDLLYRGFKAVLNGFSGAYGFDGTIHF